MYCKSCGAENGDGVKFCTQCGSKLIEETGASYANSTKKTGMWQLVPYIVAILGAVLAVLANAIKYLTVSGFFYSRKVSMFEYIFEVLEKPDQSIRSTADMVFLCIIIAGILMAVLSLLFALLRKMKVTIFLAVLAIVPFLMISSAWIHYAGAVITLVGAIWYLIVNKKA